MAGAGQVARGWDLDRIIKNYEQRINTLEKLSGTRPATDPLGNLSYVESTTADRTSASAVPVEIVELTASVDVVAGRRYKVTAVITTYSTVATDIAGLRLDVDGANQGSYTTSANSGGAATGQATTLVWIYDPAATGTDTFAVYVFRAAGTGTVHAVGSANSPIFCLVEDIGTV